MTFVLCVPWRETSCYSCLSWLCFARECLCDGGCTSGHRLLQVSICPE